MQSIDDAHAAGARLENACKETGISQRTYERWKADPEGEDARHGPKRKPANALSAQERAELLRVVNTPEYRNLSPKQIVPKLADKGAFLGSESTIYRNLRAAGQTAHRGSTKPRVKRERPCHTASGPNQVWSWDITYLPTNVRGMFFYLYLVMDIWSRKIVGWSVHPCESMEHSSRLIAACCTNESIDGKGLILHADNGGAMKGSTMLATLERLGVVPSFSRPSVSDDNPFSEALFRYVKHVPSYPSMPFASVDAASEWVSTFVAWYNETHQHSGIQFVTPGERHRGEDVAILARRAAVYEKARRRHPERWTGEVRNWTPVEAVVLGRNVRRSSEKKSAEAQAA